MNRPDKPHPDYPLFANQNGQWCKKVKGKPYYFGKWADDPKGITFYRLRHTFKTLGKRARDREALDLMMGHEDRSIGKRYDHEEIGVKRVRRVARVVYRKLWPKPKAVTPEVETPLQPGQMRLAV